MKLTRIAAALLLGALAPAAGAHDVECDTYLATVAADGATRTSDYAVVLPVAAYPALVIAKTSVWNTHPTTSAVDVAAAPLLEQLGLAGPFVAPFSLAAGETQIAYTPAPLRIESHAACLDLAAQAGAPANTPYLDLRFVFQHVRGGAECRARVLCLAPVAQ